MNKQQTQKKITQIKHVENHLLLYGKITTQEAITSYWITRLAEYIRILRNKDWDIDSEWKHNSERRWVEYQLKNYPNS